MKRIIKIIWFTSLVFFLPVWVVLLYWIATANGYLAQPLFLLCLLLVILLKRKHKKTTISGGSRFQI